jgi:hypothetical protein
MAEQPNRTHRRTQLNPAPPMPQASRDVAKRRTKKEHERHQDYHEPRKPRFRHTLYDVIMGVGPMQVG